MTPCLVHTSTQIIQNSYNSVNHEAMKKTSLVLVDKRDFFRAKDYLNGAELGEKLPKSNVPVLLDKLEFVYPSSGC